MPYPQALRSDKNAGLLEIAWDDDTLQRLDSALLRHHCPCAECKSLRQRGKNHAASATPPSIRDVRLVGRYAAQIVFSDGHDRGIFPWVYLKELNQE
ncbi:gamma-butyrobetaine hydroxylase-like domain-containing protein [Janthinobacterium sp. 17J80-10]|uniref:gamma-butyrobetaine hydroxylase-like domain-containing protein n=1 Tax=Janthinobacterium sp. 17J80-10 TaxID=2497863 RepID=UPI0010055419|nr:gamma-butyrobetaine hydroxylase-like domain-containing protein [Janthinobacterium sp. 17J80-10]QAU33929.1 DUF971 domain-containing protein [Janthinobacterium sp. 17J80-10]